jgi:GAF domain-containing protein
MSQITSPNQSLWQRLFAPHPGITSQVERERARALAVISLALVGISFVALLYVLLDVKEVQAIYALPFLVVFVLAYAFSRTPQAMWGSRLLVFGMATLDFSLLLSATQLNVVTAITTFVLLPILFATVLVDARLTLLLAALSNAGLAVYFSAAGWFSFSDVLVPFLGTLLIAILAVITAFLRERDLAIIRQQQSALDRHSHSLEGQVDQRTRNILATAEIGRVVATARELDSMLKQVVDLITERFNYYYAQVFMVDEAGKQAVLKAGTGPAGEKLLAAGHRLPVGSQSIVGQATATGNAIVVTDTDIDPLHRRNELLPHTRSEVVLPLRASGRVIGALNIQSTTPNAFQSTEVTVFQTIADQLAVAVENAQLFARAQRDLQDIETLNRQLTGEAWRKYLSGRAPDLPSGFAGSTAGIQPVASGESETAEGSGAAAVSLPLKVRGETIGMLDVTPRSGQVPDEQMKTMLEAVAERVALALDSTRVGEQAQRQAEREQILSAISAELQATTDLNVILRTVAREASRAMAAPHSFIHLAMVYSEEQKPRADDKPERKKIK